MGVNDNAIELTDEEVRIYNVIKDFEMNMSQWFLKIKDCGIKVPETEIFILPAKIFWGFASETKEGLKATEEFINYVVANKMLDGKKYFIKNGCYSGKFNFSNCIVDSTDIADKFMDINYESMCLETGGETEIVLRDVIPTEKYLTTMYNGMPIRPEFRVFYDFDKRKALYSANYWDYNALKTKIHNEKDLEALESVHLTIDKKYRDFEDKALETVAEHFEKVDMKGIWSVDLLLDDNDEFWLIDMAVAWRSYYWDENKIKN